MIGIAFLAAAVLVLGVFGPLVLYALVRAEHDQWEATDRDGGERAARRDTED